ncbi:hypothetical protein VMCG_03764 [Cytospora schulzeri]|uniref:2EXR domain-containing protein n=1 Tax=Cytospora schulzeri TaxID=448051 RepID=A0A423WUM5_9PEZI|nr:hypothetical protein VMCG_03764 [Valsa malicola]
MSQSQVNQSQLSGEFNMFQCLPTELQLMIFEAALDNLAKPRIVILDIETAPTYNSRRSRDLTLGWQLKVDNHEELTKENPLGLARSLLQTCETGEYVVNRFINSHRIWDPPHHCHELLSKDLSLSFDVFWLPDDLFAFHWLKTFHPAGREDWRDEESIACLMVSMDSLEEVARWAMGRFDEQDRQDEANNYVSFEGLSRTLENVLTYYPSCEEIIVMVGAPSGDRKHVSWSDLNYVHADDKQMVPKFDLYAADRDEADQCQSLAQTYYALSDNAMESDGVSMPVLSFAFNKDSKQRNPPAPVPQITIPAGSGSRKRTHDEDDDAAVLEMPASKRQRT